MISLKFIIVTQITYLFDGLVYIKGFDWDWLRAQVMQHPNVSIILLKILSSFYYCYLIEKIFEKIHPVIGFMLWVGNAGCITPTHYDQQHVFLSQVIYSFPPMR